MLKRVNLKNMAKDIIAMNQYMTLGTVNADQKAWVSPVAYAFDAHYNLYFMTLPSSRHGTNIQRDSHLSLAIFDSRQLFGEGVGLQITGEAKMVPVRDSLYAVKCYFGRKWPYDNLANVKDFNKFFTVYKYRFYRIRPVEIWMNDPRREYDIRVKVRL